MRPCDIWLLSPDFTSLAYACVLTQLACSSNYRNTAPFLVLLLNKKMSLGKDGLLYGNDDGYSTSGDFGVRGLHAPACFCVSGCLRECRDSVDFVE